MARRKKEIWLRRKTEKTSVGVKIPQGCSNCAWKDNKTTIAKIKCNNKDAEVLQEEDEWVCHSFTTYASNNKRKRR